MDRMKSWFFTHVSHEFRTPLTLIRGPVDDLMEKARLNKKEHHKLEMISRNARRMLEPGQPVAGHRQAGKPHHEAQARRR